MPLLPVCLALALCAGVALSLTTPLDTAAGLVGLLVSTAAAAAAAWRSRGWLVLVAAMGGVCGAGAALGAHADLRARAPRLPALLDLRDPGGIVVEGVLAEDASSGPNGARLRLSVRRLGDEEVDGVETVALTVGGTLAGQQIASWRAGRALRTVATLRRPAVYLNPGAADDRLALARRGLTLVGSVKSAALVEVIAAGSWRQERSADLRAFVRGALATHVAPRDRAASAVATAILIGDRAGLDPDLERRLQLAGTYHVIAISGGNIAVLTLVLLAAARALGLSPQTSGPVVAALLTAHAGLVGGGDSVARATAMAVISLGLRVVDQSAWSLNALAAATVGLVAVRPLSVVDPGLVLSVGATAAIIVMAPRLEGQGTAAGWTRAARGILWASLATELVLLPVSAVFFNRITAAGLALNLAAVPLMAVVQVAASLTVMAHAAMPSLASACGAVTAAAAGGLTASATLVDWLPWLVRRVPSPPVWASSAYLLCLAGVVVSPHVHVVTPRWASRLRRGAAGVAAVCACWILAAPSTWRWPWRADGWLRVVTLDVGQGDATLVEFPDGARWLVDAGGLPRSLTFDVGERVVAPALWARGTGRLDALVLTHGDPDHVGGAAAVLSDFGPVILEGVPVPGHAPLERLRGLARARGRRWASLVRGDVWAIGGVRLEVWHPPPPDWERQRVRNDDSIVLELRYGDVSIVLPGDIGAEVEAEIAGAMRPAGTRVVKAAHHGSATSTSGLWLDALRPDVVIVSCGRENRYGHPAGPVLRRIGDRGATIFRTDQDGQVVVETDGKALSVHTFTGRSHETRPRSPFTHSRHPQPRRHDDTMTQ